MLVNCAVGYLLSFCIAYFLWRLLQRRPDLHGTWVATLAATTSLVVVIGTGFLTIIMTATGPAVLRSIAGASPDQLVTAMQWAVPVLIGAYWMAFLGSIQWSYRLWRFRYPAPRE